MRGVPKNVRAMGQKGRGDIRQGDERSLPDGRDSVYAKGFKMGDLKFVSGSNEYSVKSVRQSYPEFVVYWCHAD